MSGNGRDADVLAAGYDYEQATRKIVSPTYLENALGVPVIGEVMKPATGRQTRTTNRRRAP